MIPSLKDIHPIDLQTQLEQTSDDPHELNLHQHLQQNHPDLAERVVGAIAVNEQHMTEDQLLAEARSFYATTKLG